MAGLPLVLRDLPCYKSTFGNAYYSVSDEDFSAAVTYLLANPEQLHTLKKEALAMASSYRSGNYAKELLEVYALVTELSGPRR